MVEVDAGVGFAVEDDAFLAAVVGGVGAVGVSGEVGVVLFLEGGGDVSGGRVWKGGSEVVGLGLEVLTYLHVDLHRCYYSVLWVIAVVGVHPHAI